MVNDSIMIPTTWKGWFGKGKVDYDQLTATKELINNLIQTKKLVNAQIVIDTVTDMMWVTDDMSGIDADLLPGIYIGGQSYANGTLLSEHGDGLTITTNYWGTLQYTKTSVDGCDFDMVKLDRSKEYASLKQIYNQPPIQRYSVDKKGWIDTDVPGFQTKIKLHEKNSPSIVTWFDNLVRGLEGAYWKYLGENLNLEIVWLKKGKFHKHFDCKPTNILLTKNPKHGTIDNDGKLGYDDWDYEDIYKCKKTGIIAELKIGNAPSPDLVNSYYGEDVYNDYIQSPYCYNGSMIGIHYSKAWVPIADSQFKASSRGESLVGFINIVDGIDTVQTKNGIVRPTDGTVEIFEEELEKEVFVKHGFRVRAQKNYHKISESEMEKDILNLLQTDTTIRSVMGFTDKNTFDKKNTVVNGGVPDINCYQDKNEVIHEAIIEVKKEGGDRLWKAIVQGIAYCEGTKSKRLIIVAQDKDLKKEMWDKIRPLARMTKAYLGDFSVDYFQYQYLNNLNKKLD